MAVVFKNAVYANRRAADNYCPGCTHGIITALLRKR